jgi:hypothetical protein
MILFALGLIVYHGWRASTSFLNEPSDKPHYMVESGKKLNSVRHLKRIPAIEEDWTIERYDSTSVTWVTPIRPYPQRPTHIKKTISYKNSQPEQEEDDFQFTKSDTLSYRLVLTSKYLDSANIQQFSQRMIMYCKNPHWETKSIDLSKDEADSVLLLWKIRF